MGDQSQGRTEHGLVLLSIWGHRLILYYEADSGSWHRLPKMRETHEERRDGRGRIGHRGNGERVSDINVIVSLDVMMTPALVIDGDVKVVGKVPTPEDIEKLLA